MRTIRLQGRGPKSLFLVAESELDKSLVTALRTFGAVALYLHRELPDKPFEELVRAESEQQVDGERLALELMDTGWTCPHGLFSAKGVDGRCMECLGERRKALLEALAEVEVRVLCCRGAKADGSGHDDGCAVVPAQEARGAEDRRYHLGVAQGLSRALARWQGLRRVHDDTERAEDEFVRQMGENITDEMAKADVSPWAVARDDGAPEWPPVVAELVELAEAAEMHEDRLPADLSDALSDLREARKARTPAAGLSS